MTFLLHDASLLKQIHIYRNSKFFEREVDVPTDFFFSISLFPCNFGNYTRPLMLYTQRRY
jgi:hypothetical protein